MNTEYTLYIENLPALKLDRAEAMKLWEHSSFRYEITSCRETGRRAYVMRANQTTGALFNLAISVRTNR